MAITNRLDAAMILGAKVWICRLGTEIPGSVSGNKVSDTVLPELPSSYDEPGAWVPLGKIRSSKPQTDYKTVDIEGVPDDGTYSITELKLATKRKIQFSTNDITPEAFELTFGLQQQITPGGEQAVFASGNDSLEVWLVMELTDAYRSTQNLARITLRGKLSLQNPLEAKSDPAQADYELNVVVNPLATWLEGNIMPS